MLQHYYICIHEWNRNSHQIHQKQYIYIYIVIDAFGRQRQKNKQTRSHQNMFFCSQKVQVIRPASRRKLLCIVRSIDWWRAKSNIYEAKPVFRTNVFAPFLHDQRQWLEYAWHRLIAQHFSFLMSPTSFDNCAASKMVRNKLPSKIHVRKSKSNGLLFSIKCCFSFYF
jgi:hypothetical protein